MAFFARRSDPLLGGTYMTLLNTMANMGSQWPVPAALWALDALSSKRCVIAGGVDGAADLLGGANGGVGGAGGACWGEAAVRACRDAGGACETERDGVLALLAGCTALGVGWLVAARPVVRWLRELDDAAWCAPPRADGGGRRGKTKAS